jgi:hypothetical protein
VYCREKRPLGRFFRNYAGRSNSFRHNYVNKYTYLLAKKESGELSIPEERDGWKMENPTGRKVIYVKG